MVKERRVGRYSARHDTKRGGGDVPCGGRRQTVEERCMDKRRAGCFKTEGGGTGKCKAGLHQERRFGVGLLIAWMHTRQV